MSTPSYLELEAKLNTERMKVKKYFAEDRK